MYIENTTGKAFHPTSTTTNLATAGFTYTISTMDIAGISFVQVTASPLPTDRPFDGLIIGDVVYIDLSGGDNACCMVTKVAYNSIHIRTHGTTIAQGAPTVITGGTDTLEKIDYTYYPKCIKYFSRAAGGKINGRDVPQTADFETLFDQEKTSIPHAFEGDFSVRIPENNN